MGKWEDAKSGVSNLQLIDKADKIFSDRAAAGLIMRQLADLAGQLDPLRTPETAFVGSLCIPAPTPRRATGGLSRV